ncbi:MAG TPA: HAD family hydrolase [Polyangiaceae bacterium]|nr:HAD family hydrolase [Polyangiaceae bacterium]
MRPTVHLFDIDGTLITTGGVGRKAIEVAFERRYSRRDACTFPFDGMTDKLIARLGLEAIGVEPTSAEIDALLVEYVEVLKLEVAAADSKTYRVHAGMEEAILAGREQGHAVGLGTGNLRAGARVKLERVDVYKYFPFGGFGCDAEERALVIRRGAERGAEQLGVPLEECRVVVIGDTPKDVAAAQAIGAESIGVATGSYSVEALLGCGATHAFADLAAPGALAALVGS